MPTLALATCANLPGWEVDDRPLHAALAARGCALAHPAWSDASVDWSRFDATILRTTWDYTDAPARFLAWVDSVPAACPLFNPAPIVRWNADKSYLRALEARGVAIAPTAWLTAGETVDLAAVMRERGLTRAFIKPANGASARETLRFDGRDPDQLAAAQAHLDRLLPRETLLLQPYLARVEREGELSAIYFDGQLSHAVRKIPVAGDYRVQDDYGAADQPHRLRTDERELAEQALAAFAEIVRELPGEPVELPLLYARVDLLHDDDDRPLLCELELIEPSLFFRHSREAADRLSDALLARLPR